MSKFSERLVETLKAKGISQNAFSKQLGFNQTTINQWCRGECETDFDTLLLICKTLGENPNYMLGYED